MAGPETEGRPARAALEERPPAPWGSFPLQELAVLVALVMLGIGLFSGNPVAIAVGVVLGCLAGLELSLREHLAGYRSHTTLIAGTAFVLTVAVLYYAAQLVLIVCLGVGARGLRSRLRGPAPSLPEGLRRPLLQGGRPAGLSAARPGRRSARPI